MHCQVIERRGTAEVKQTLHFQQLVIKRKIIKWEKEIEAKGGCFLSERYLIIEYVFHLHDEYKIRVELLKQQREFIDSLK